MRKIAGNWSRIIALLIDFIVLGLIGQLIGLAFFHSLSRMGTESLFIGFFISLLYFTLGYSKLLKGQTIGKMALSIRVVNSSEDYLGLFQSFIRALIFISPFTLTTIFGSQVFTSQLIVLKVFLVVFSFSSFLLLVFNRKGKQSYHDLFVQSHVINVRSEAENHYSGTNRKYLLSAIMVSMLLFVALSFWSFSRFEKNAESNSQLQMLNEEVKSLDHVINCGISEKTVYSGFRQSGDKSFGLQLVVKVDYPPEWEDVQTIALVDELKGLIESKYAKLAALDFLHLHISYGFTIGFAKRHTSLSNTFPMREQFSSGENSNLLDAESSGALRYPENYTNDVIEDEQTKILRTWHTNGMIETESVYILGKLEGKSRSWYDNGQLEMLAEYKNGKRHGITVNYFKNGQKKEVIEYHENSFQRYIQKWNEDGKEVAPEL